MKNKRAGFFSLWLPVIGWCGLLYYLSSIPSLKTAPDPQIDEFLRSLAHFFFYAFLSLLFFRALYQAKSSRNYFWPFFLSFGYGFIDEVHQLLVPTRTFQFIDLLLDGAGALAGMILLAIFLKKAPSELVRLAQKLSIL